MEKKFSDLMVDLETLSLDLSATIIQIGAVEFDIKNGKIGQIFVMQVSAEDCESHGMTTDTETLEWWMRQGEKILDLVTNDQKSLKFALDSFSYFCLQGSYERIWSNPGHFDFPILRNAYSKYPRGSKEDYYGIPWNHKNQRCLKTLLDMGDITYDDVPFKGIKHYAPDDCLWQIELATLAYQQVKFEG